MVLARTPMVAGLIAVGLASGMTPVHGDAASCSVPSVQHPTLAAALADPQCSPIVLAAGVFAETVEIGRSVTVQGASSASTVIQGQVRVVAGTVALNGLSIDTSGPDLRGRFTQALLADGAARVSGLDLRTVHRPLLFGDGFESGSTSAWSTAVP